VERFLRYKTGTGGERKIVTEKTAHVPKRPIWTGSITIGLVNVPVKLYRMIFERGFSFRFLHKQDGQPLKYQKVCVKDNLVVPWEDTVRGYEVSKNEFIVFTKEELQAARPESDRRIRLDKFVDFYSIDPLYFETTYILAPDKNPEAYALLLKALEKTEKAAAGTITLRTKEYPAVVQAHKGVLILNTLRYDYEVADPSKLEELKKLKEPSKDELDLAAKIVEDLSGEFNIGEYEDAYKQKIEDLIQKKLKGETIVVERPEVKEEAKELMVALKQTLEQLKKK
jgi:DNA end-binding protein Ku